MLSSRKEPKELNQGRGGGENFPVGDEPNTRNQKINFRGGLRRTAQ